VNALHDADIHAALASAAPSVIGFKRQSMGCPGLRNNARAVVGLRIRVDQRANMRPPEFALVCRERGKGPRDASVNLSGAAEPC